MVFHWPSLGTWHVKPVGMFVLRVVCPLTDRLIIINWLKLSLERDEREMNPRMRGFETTHRINNYEQSDYDEYEYSDIQYTYDGKFWKFSCMRLFQVVSN